MKQTLTFLALNFIFFFYIPGVSVDELINGCCVICASLLSLNSYLICKCLGFFFILTCCLVCAVSPRRRSPYTDDDEEEQAPEQQRRLRQWK